jgi:hypothetical protein
VVAHRSTSTEAGHPIPYHKSNMEQPDTSPLVEFFATYGRVYDPQRPVHSQWRSLQKRFKRDGMSRAEQVNASAEYLDAVAQEFGHLFGTSTNDLESMQSLAQELHINPVPDNLPTCTLVRCSFLTFS